MLKKKYLKGWGKDLSYRYTTQLFGEVDRKEGKFA